MDAISALLDKVRAHSAVFTRSLLDPPWSLRFVDGAPIRLLTMLSGRAWISTGTGEPHLLGAGDVALLAGGGPVTVADTPVTGGAPPTVTVHSDDLCVGADGTPLGEDRRLDHYSWGTTPDARDAVLSCAYEVTGEIARRVLSELPALVVLGCEDEEEECPEVALVLAELRRRRAPGRQVVLDRLLDLLLVSTLREWFARDGTPVPGWYRALDDPVVSEALRLIHEEPARPWTVGELARRSGASRAAFARRFGQVVGEPPMAYLTGWRLALAADLLRESGETVGAIARRVGYADASALSVAFKRAHAVRPTAHREARAS